MTVPSTLNYAAKAQKQRGQKLFIHGAGRTYDTVQKKPTWICPQKNCTNKSRTHQRELLQLLAQRIGHYKVKHLQWLYRDRS